MIFLIDIPIYNKEVVFIFGNDRGEAVRWLGQAGLYGSKKFESEDLDEVFGGQHNGIVFSNDDGYLLMVRVDHEGNHRTIAHEIYHAACKIMDWVSIHPSAMTEEAYAYLIGHITAEVYKRLENESKRLD